ADGLPRAEVRLAAVQLVERAQAVLADVPALDDPAHPDEGACDAARAAADAAGRELGEVEGRLKAATDELARARRQVEHAGAVAEALAAVSPPPQPGEGSSLVGEVERRRQAKTQCEVLRDRLLRRDALEHDAKSERERVADLGGRLQALREKVGALAFKPEA